MRDITKSIKCQILFLFLLFSFTLTAQVGIGTTTPSESLDVIGNIEFSGSLKPNNSDGNANQILVSGGPNTAPAWGLELVNTTQITKFGKYFSGLFNIPTGPFTLTLTDADCVITSTAFISWVGNLPAGPDYGDLIVTTEAQNGQWVFHIYNHTGFTLSNFQFSYVAAY